MIKIKVKESANCPHPYKQGELWINQTNKTVVMCSDEVDRANADDMFGGICIASEDDDEVGVHSIYWHKEDFVPFIGKITFKST